MPLSTIHFPPENHLLEPRRCPSVDDVDPGVEGGLLPILEHSDLKDNSAHTYIRLKFELKFYQNDMKHMATHIMVQKNAFILTCF